jgi:hypothetical protein
MFSELKDLEASGINVSDLNNMKDIAGLDSTVNFC